MYSPKEQSLFKSLSSPQKIQDYLNSLKFNFEKNRETCMSPRFVIQKKTAHCMEGALFAAAALEFHGGKPLVLDLRAVKKPLYDDDHVVAVFKRFGCFGAISKTNHGVLRYREPIYKTVRELVLSYFHEYFLNSSGQKTLREYSDLCDLRFFDSLDWRISETDLFEIPTHLDKIKHHRILSAPQINNLRKAEEIEKQMGKIIEYKK